ncbi:LOW QUALITY PROTEIN: uridine diphosphate glucose pyrophosphatase NUDT14 [Thomomys bottae]
MYCIEGVAVRRCPGSPYLRPYALHYRQNGVHKSWDFMKTHDSSQPPSISSPDHSRVGPASVLSPSCSVTILMFNTSQRSQVRRAGRAGGIGSWSLGPRGSEGQSTGCGGWPVPVGGHHGALLLQPAVYANEVERRFPESLAVTAQDGPRSRVQGCPAVGVTLELCAGLVDQPGLSLEKVACKEALEKCGYHLDPWDLQRVATCRAGVGPGSSQTVFYAEVTDAQRSALGGGVAEEGEVIDVVHLPLDGAQAFANDPDIPKTLGVLFVISCFFSQIAPHLGPQQDPEVLPDLPPSTNKAWTNKACIGTASGHV